jgi:hypothetical protein
LQYSREGTLAQFELKLLRISFLFCPLIFGHAYAADPCQALVLRDVGTADEQGKPTKEGILKAGSFDSAITSFQQYANGNQVVCSHDRVWWKAAGPLKSEECRVAGTHCPASDT